jgi:hypothetical protein
MRTLIMKPYITAFLTAILLMTLLSLQFYLLACESHSQFNPLLIFYIYILSTNCSMTTLTFTGLMLDSMTYLTSEIFGITILFLTPLSWLTLKIKNDMYNKIVIPCLFVFFYAIFYNIALSFWLQKSIGLGLIFLSTIQNCAGFLFLWWASKQPFHD